MKAMIGIALMIFGATASLAPPVQAASANEPYFWKGIRYRMGPSTVAGLFATASRGGITTAIANSSKGRHPRRQAVRSYGP